MKLAAPLLALAFLPAYAHAAPSQAPDSSAMITVTRTGNGCDITLPADASKTVTDQIWLVVDGKSEGFGGGYYNPDAVQARTIHYIASASSDMDGQVKDILKAQGFPVKAGVITYHIVAGVTIPTNNGIYVPADVARSQTLHFRHDSYILANTLIFPKKAYTVGDKIPILDVLALDSSITMQDALGPNNDISSGKFVHLPNDLLHRITIQVQFVPVKDAVR